MADKKISELGATVTAGSADLLAIVQSNITKKITFSNLKNSLINASVLTSGYLPYWDGSTFQDSYLQRDSNGIVLDVNKTIRSNVSNKSQISFGVSGDEIILSNDGSSLGDAYMILNTPNILIANDFGEFASSATGAWVQNDAKISLMAPLVGINTLNPNVQFEVNGDTLILGGGLRSSGISVGAYSPWASLSNEISTFYSSTSNHLLLQYSHGGAVGIGKIPGITSGLDIDGDFVVSDSIQGTYATASTIPYWDGLKHLVSSAITPTELGYLTGASSNLQAQIDALVSGLSWKQAVRAATTSSGVLATDFENGDMMDGVVLATGDRVLIKDQASAPENGIYIVQAIGAPVRSSDMNSGAEFPESTVAVSEGTVNGDKQFVCTTNAPVVVGVTNITFVLVGGTTYVGTTNRITVTGNVIDIDSSYAGQSSITTLGTITTGVWQGTLIDIARGGTNSSAALVNNRVMVSEGGAIVEADAITIDRVLISDANGLPVHSSVTATTLGFLDATSSIQSQLNNKAPLNAWVDISGTATVVGWSSFVSKTILYLDVGSAYLVTINIAGTSNSSSATVQLPFQSAEFIGGIMYGTNNGNAVAGRWAISAGADTIVTESAVAGTAWASSGTKRITITFHVKK